MNLSAPDEGYAKNALCALVAFLLPAALYQGNTDWNHKFWNIISIEILILHLHMQLL